MKSKSKDKAVDYRVSWKVNSRKKGGRGRGQRVVRMFMLVRCAERGGKSARRARAGALVLARALVLVLAKLAFVLARALELEVKMQQEERERQRNGVMMARWV